jgi:predicted HD phosphohydrolase
MSGDRTLALIEGAGPVAAPLAQPDWRYIEKPDLESFEAGDWQLLNRQRVPFYEARQADRVLALLTAERDDPTYGYRINNYQHCLQSATMAHRAGLDEEVTVVALLHDVGFTTCPTTHGPFAAALLGAYIAERNHWMLERHQVFQLAHLHGYPGIDPEARDRWRGHAHFEWTATFVERFDQNAIDPDYPTAPLDFFVPMVRRIFARSPRPVAIEPG